MTLGEGAAISVSWKQKVNTKNLTETKLVGVYDAISTRLWALYFMQALGYEMSHTAH